MTNNISDMRKEYDSVKEKYDDLKSQAKKMLASAKENVESSISDYNDIIDIIGSGNHLSLSSDVESIDDSERIDEKNEDRQEATKPAARRRTPKKQRKEPEPIEEMDPTHIEFGDKDNVVVSGDDAEPETASTEDDNENEDIEDDGLDFLG
jgi:uncharacterized membrane-anchored protein YhcB (DUF1043 family)